MSASFFGLFKKKKPQDSQTPESGSETQAQPAKSQAAAVNPEIKPAASDAAAAKPQEQTAAKNGAQSATQPENGKSSFFSRLRRTRENLSYGLEALVKGRKIDDDLFEDLETSLLTADLGVETTERIIEKLRSECKLRALHDAAALKESLNSLLCSILEPCSSPLTPERSDGKPFVILMIGVNGAGKTTTIGKLALKFKAQGKKVMLAAGDTFRAAAVEQLLQWGEHTGVPVIHQETGSDSASVIYDALSAATARHADILICDTAGRLQNKENLMDELRKIVRVMKKLDSKAPNETLMVLDSTTGQNAVSQVRLFNKAVPITGLALTKLDGTAKGGVVFALCDEFRIPVRFVGIGEKTEDLREFDAAAFTKALTADAE